MKIAQYAAALSAKASSVFRHTQKETLHYWNNALDIRQDGGNPESSENDRSIEAIRDTVDIRADAAKVYLKKNEKPKPGHEMDLEEGTHLSPKLQIVKELLERMTGRKIHFTTIHETAEEEPPSSAAQKPETNEQEPQRQGWGLDYTYVEETYTKQGIDFFAKGQIITGDDRIIHFDVTLQMSRETYLNKQISIKAGDALTDPLIINLDGRGAELGSRPWAFDLNVDSIQEQMNFLKPGSGFLALDKNANGLIDDGSELFGPQSGNGFNELTLHDSDSNHWIDENDPVFYALRIWEKDEQGQDVITPLSQKNIGAIFLGKAKTDFELVDQQSSTLGQLRETGLYLKENGEVGFVQEIDMVI